MTVIGTNVSALRAANASNSASSALATSMERLSTGKRINSAKDDAAGLAIASRMTSTVKSMAVAIRNANDGISMAQTAEGALGEVTNMLQRMKELATQSANGTLGTSERAALQAETDQLTSQINDISKTTNFNGQNLLDGSAKSLKLQTGTTSGDKVSVTLASVDSAKLGLTGSNGQVTSGRVTAGSVAVGAVTLNGINAIAGTAATTTTSAADLAAAFNTNSARTGVTATASNNVTTAAITGSVAAGQLQIGGKSVGAAASAEELVNNINNNDYGVTATLNDDKSVTLSNTDGKNIDLTNTGGSALTMKGDATAGVNVGFVSLTSNDGSNVTIGGTGMAAAGLNKSDGVSFYGAAVTATGTGGLNADVSLNGVKITQDANATTALLLATAINKQSADTGVKATAVDSTGAVSGTAANNTYLKLESNDGSPVRVEGAAAKLGFVAQGGTDANTSKIDISTQSAASAAMAKIDKALDSISATRGNLGAIQNRLEVTVSNLTTTSTNLADSRSRIEDADFSAESTNLAKAQILSQASTAMLAQANQSQQSVLKLLQ